MFGLTQEQLEEMASVDVHTINKEAFTDLRDIVIDKNLPVEEKIKSFIAQTNNIYVHRIGDYVVKVTFQENGASIDDRLREYLRHLAEGASEL